MSARYNIFNNYGEKMNKSAVFVDCFNTIIRRNKSPRDVLFDWAKAVGASFSIEPAVIFQLYKKYEAKTYIANKFKTGEGEYLFRDVVKKLAEYIYIYMEEANTDFDRQNFIEKAVELYVKIEADSHYLNEEVVSKLQNYKDQGCKIYVVSDFYCGGDILKIWLNNLGASAIFDDVFVSCDFKKSKRTGKLYKHLLKKLNLNRKDVVMIGDNRHADINKARLNGISAIKVNSKNKCSDKKISKQIKRGVNFYEYSKIFDEFGGNFNYSNYAFPFYLYYKRLCKQLQERNVKNVLFMSREGQFMKKLFDEYCKINNYKFNTHYFYVSRNSVLTASLKPLQEETFAIMLRSVATMNIKRFLATLNFSKSEIDAISSEIPEIDIEKSYKNFTSSKAFFALKNQELFQQLYEQKRVEQRASLDCYLKSFNIDFEKEQMHLVDVGWYGTIQDYLSKFFDGKVQTVGYYVGTFDKHKVPNSTKLGLFFSCPSNKIYGNRMLRHRRMDYEQIYRADHNRCKGYKIVDGKPEIILGDEQNENKIFNQIILPLQNQIYDKFVKICKLDYKYFSTIEPVVLKMFYKMICKQSKQDFEWLKASENSTYDNFARIGFTYTRFKDSLRMFAYKGWDFFFKLRFAPRIWTLKYVRKT